MAEARVRRVRVNSARDKHVQDSVLIRKTVPGNNYRDVVPPTPIERELNELRTRILRTRRPSQRLRNGLIVNQITQSIAAQQDPVPVFE